MRYFIKQPLLPFQRSAAATLGSEAERGWNPDYHWAAAEDRTWYRGNGDEDMASDLRFGRYALVAGVHPRPQVGNPAGVGSRFRIRATGPLQNAVPVEHTWRDNQVAGLRATLGVYGLADYLPANAILALQGAVTADLAADVPEARLRMQGWNRSQIRHGGLDLERAGQWSPLRPMGCLVVPRSYYANWNSPTAGWDESRFLEWNTAMGALWGARVGETFGGAFYALRSATVLRPVLFPGRKPEAWPDLYLGSTRARIRTATVNVASVRLVDVASGEAREISFNTFGTSLRGARQQRAIAGGWARWRGPGLANDPTLDYQPAH